MRVLFAVNAYYEVFALLVNVKFINTLHLFFAAEVLEI